MASTIPKPAAMRQRRNRTTTAATLHVDAPWDTFPGDLNRPPRIPPLPRDRDWRPETRRWWKDVWSSPMISEYITVDRHGLLVLADLVDRFWSGPTTTQSMGLAAEIRQQGMRFGLSPIDRRRLQWEVKRVAPSAPPAVEPEEPPADPRSLLAIV